jgi:hypothetical protein
VNPALLVKGGARRSCDTLVLKSKPLILEIQPIIRHPGYPDPERAFLTYPKELVPDNPGPDGVVFFHEDTKPIRQPPDSRRPIFNATLRARSQLAVFLRRGGSVRMDPETGTSLPP